MRFAGAAAACALWLPLAVPATAADEPALAASRPWTVDYDDDSCALRRVFGEGDNQVYLEMRRFQPNFGLQTIISSNSMKARRPANFRYRFTGDADWRRVSGANTVTQADGFSGVLFTPTFLDLSEYEAIEDPAERAARFKDVDWHAVELEAARKIATLELRGAFKKDLMLQLGPLDKPIAALQGCIDELLTHWDIDVEAHKSLTRRAAPIDLAGAASMIGYPPKMVRQGMPGVVNIRLAIDERGRITGCRIQMPLSDPTFEASSCDDIRHAFEFEPALDKDGKPIASYWITRIHFVLR